MSHQAGVVPTQMSRKQGKFVTVLSCNAGIAARCMLSFPLLFSAAALAVSSPEAPSAALIPADSGFGAKESMFDFGTWASSVLLRAELSKPRLETRFPAPAVAGQSLLADLNLSGKKEFSQLIRIQADADAYVRRSWNYRKRVFSTAFPSASGLPVENGVETSQRGMEDNPDDRFTLNEFYLNGEISSGVQYTVGKKRVLWGTGFASNPTDLLNPAKNPLDPSYERRGAWLLQVENIGETRTLAFMFAPEVLEDKNSLPTDVGYFRDPDGQRRFHALFGGRWYSLVGEADLNLMLFRSQHFRGGRNGGLMGGVAWSQIASFVSKKLETHAEVLTRQGSGLPSPSGAVRAQFEDWYTHALFGLRYDFENESSLSLEFLHKSDGDTNSDLAARLRSASIALVRAPMQVAGAFQAPAMRNTVYVNYQRYKFNDDTFLSWAAILNPHDFSGYQGPQLQWSASQETTLTLSASSDFNLSKEAGAEVGSLGYVRTNELNPVSSRIGFELKSFF